MYFHNDAERTANAEVSRLKLFDSRMISLVQPLLWRIETPQRSQMGSIHGRDLH
jgi:hypothetical protein